MTKSYKMLTVLAMLNAGKLPGAISIEDLEAGFARLARRNGTLRAELGEALDNASELRKLLEKNPIDAWTGGKGTGDQSLFTYDGRELRTTFDVPSPLRELFQELTRELADWRLGEYLDRHHEPLEGIVCKVSHANQTPILFLPDRSAQAGIPDGWTPIDIEGERYEANFVKVAVNVIRRPGNPRNELPTILRQWFGATRASPAPTSTWCSNAPPRAGPSSPPAAATTKTSLYGRATPASRSRNSSALAHPPVAAVRLHLGRKDHGAPRHTREGWPT